MTQSIYLETSIVSYLTARRGRDIVAAAHQQITHEWWGARSRKFDLFVSQLVIQEASDGDKEAAKRRLKQLEDIPLLEVNQEAVELASSFFLQAFYLEQQWKIHYILQLQRFMV